MFDIKCIYCEFFSKDELCRKGLTEETCNEFSPVTDLNGDKPNCENCAWNTDGFCDFDEENPLTCRRFTNRE